MIKREAIQKRKYEGGVHLQAKPRKTKYSHFTCLFGSDHNNSNKDKNKRQPDSKLALMTFEMSL